MGVSGSGKTTIAQLLSQKINTPYFDADDFHSIENKNKMKAGIPLDDHDRISWLNALHDLALHHSKLEGAIITCSALKETYRQILTENLNCTIHWIVLKGDYDLISSRMEARKDHFMPPGLLSSQLNTMQYPPYGIHMPIDQAPDQIINHIIRNLGLSEFGLFGLGVMGKSLARNLASQGIKLSLFNQNIDGKEVKVAENTIQEFSELSLAQGFDEISSFVHSLSLPRKIFLMIPAGQAVDDAIQKLKPLLSAGDIIMDGGNSHFQDSERRKVDLATYSIYFIGIGVSGGEQGALKGPAIMSGGDQIAYEAIKDILNAIAAKDKNNKPCSGYIGSGGAGHFVKMIHNGIEYVEMQLLSEVYWILKKGTGKSNEEIAQLFEIWQQSELSSYLLEITIKILRHNTDGNYTIDGIADIGGSKGTGGWSLRAAADQGIPATLIADALFARYISSLKSERILYDPLKLPIQLSLIFDENKLKQAYSISRWINHHQGFEIIQAASNQYSWSINLSETARIWTNGCIIRSTMMEEVSNLLKINSNILSSQLPFIWEHMPSLTYTTTTCLAHGLAIPCISAALNYVLAITSKDSSMNLIQAQRDFFGAHTYKKAEDPFGKSYHTDWEK